MRKPIFLVHVLFLAAQTSCSIGAEEKSVLGIASSEANAYAGRQSGIFTCLKTILPEATPKTLLFSYVNDDFCDCDDGSDEPGTAACAGTGVTSFFCRNEAFEGRYLSSSRVGDGLCDCCDGSDEAAGSCQDTCHEKAQLAADEDRERREKFEKGARLRTRLVEVAKDGLEETRTEVVRSQKVFDEAFERKAVAEDNLKAYSDQEAAEQTGMTVKAQQDAELRLGLHLLSNEKLREMVVRLVRESSDQTTDAFISLANELKDIGCNTTTFGCAPYLLEQDAEDDKQKDEITDLNTDDDEEVTNDEDKDIAEIDLDEDSMQDSVEIIKARRTRERIDVSFRDAEQYVSEQAEEFRIKFNKLDESLKDLEKALQEKQGILNTDYGLDNVWYAVKDSCFDTELHGYKWQFCPLKSVMQDSVSVGKFVRWEDDGAKMIFENGQKCWNGPARSATIDLQCGDEPMLISMDEPSKCVYTGRFATPLACI
jgi:hypothetical protein